MRPKQPPPDRHWQFAAPAPAKGELGWYFSVHDRRYGPFPDRQSAAIVRAAIRQRWEARAARVGGRMWKGDGEQWFASLPPQVAVRAGVPYTGPASREGSWRALLADTPEAPGGKERQEER